ncbi:MAG TPA: class I SAM-dependent methyltransferase [Candidatus Binatia bacterium]|nr:class I SAM-dependent methyltransferase [Candidatus Binatia bacterium]
MSDAIACNLCGSRSHRLFHDQGYRRVVECEVCGLVFVEPMPTAEEKAEIERLAYESDLLPEVADFFRNCHRDFQDDPVIESFRNGLTWMGMHRTPGRLLDVGPGTGIFLYLASRDFGWEPNGVDICDESARKAREEFGITLGVGDFNTYAWEPESFDAVTMLDMLEHTIDPLASLRRAYELLEPGGVLYVVVPNQHCLMTVILDQYIRLGLPGSHFFQERLYVQPHVYYFNPHTLRRIIEHAGFETVGIRSGNVYLGRYRLPLWMRIPMEIVLQAGMIVGMGAKVLALARKPEQS